MQESFELIVVGGGSAGTYAAAAAVEYAPGTSVALISDEDRLPYKRTKISKSFAQGYERDEFALYPDEWYRANGVELITSESVQEIDRERMRVELSDGRTIGYRKLVLATGARPIVPNLSGSLADHVYTAHTAAEIDRLKWAAARSGSAVVIGMGVLGTEIAEQLSRMGLTVHLVGNRTRMIPRTLDTELSERIEGVFRSNGVKLYFEEPEQQVEGAPGEYTVRLARSRVEVSGELLVYAVGLEGRMDLARSSGLSIDKAVVVDPYLRTSDPDIYAAGDIAQQPDGRVTHLWRHGMEQGARAGENAVRSLSGEAELTYEYVPFREKCKVFGHYFFSMCVPTDQEMRSYELHRYEGGERLVRVYVKDGKVKGVSMINDLDREKTYMEAVRERWPLETLVRAVEL